MKSLDRYSHLFDINNYADEECVHFYQGEDEKTLGEPVLVPESVCSRMTFIGQAYGLHYLPMLDLYSDTVLNKVQVVSLIDELHFVLSVVGDQVLHHFLSPVIKLAEEIVRSHRDTALHVLGI